MIASRNLLAAVALAALAAPANADLISIHTEGPGFSTEWLVETSCLACDYRSGTGSASPILSAKVTIGGATLTYQPTEDTYGVLYAYHDSSFGYLSNGAKGLTSAFYININVVPGSFTLTQIIDFYSVDLPGNLNTGFSASVLPGDDSLGRYVFGGQSDILRPSAITLTPLGVPGPTAGAFGPLLRRGWKILVDSTGRYAP